MGWELGPSRVVKNVKLGNSATVIYDFDRACSSTSVLFVGVGVGDSEWLSAVGSERTERMRGRQRMTHTYTQSDPSQHIVAVYTRVLDRSMTCDKVSDETEESNSQLVTDIIDRSIECNDHSTPIVSAIMCVSLYSDCIFLCLSCCSLGVCCCSRWSVGNSAAAIPTLTVTCHRLTSSNHGETHTLHA